MPLYIISTRKHWQTQAAGGLGRVRGGRDSGDVLKKLC